MLSKITIAGMHNYSKGSIWDQLQLPEGISKELFVNEVLRQASEFSLLYPDLDFLTYQIGEFSKKWYHNFERWIKAYKFEYEALYNLDVKSTITEVGNNKEDSSKSGASNSGRKASGSASSNGHNNEDNNHYKAAYDASNPVITEKDSAGATTSAVSMASAFSTLVSNSSDIISS